MNSAPANHFRKRSNHLPDTTAVSYEIFNREFYSQLDKQGVILDGRFNGGGVAADYVIEVLSRRPLQSGALRDGEDIRLPIAHIDGPKVMLVNEWASSGGDSLAWMFRHAQLGPLVGKRTMGASVGATTVDFIDGGQMRVPDWAWYNPVKGIWDMENNGRPMWKLRLQ